MTKFEQFKAIQKEYAEQLEGNEDFLEDVEILMNLVDEAYNTDFEVKLKFKDGNITLEHDDYYCGY